ncbi:hypothetical protein E2C01_045423 [Portunus trituberculatus]|uniref:Uncharacterized protein n=1 Tax=Portunus trituberculatus TaxID=210409 RepID=A0A5B7G509_PORTR|nr:hypothetical protein [Portunus trituberculatus]
MSEERSPEGHWWSLGQQKLSNHCQKMADPIWRQEHLGSDGVENHTQKLLALAGRQIGFGPSCCRQAPTCSSTFAVSLVRSPMAPRAAMEESSRAKGTTHLRSRRGRKRRRSNWCKVSGINTMTSLSPDALTCGARPRAIWDMRDRCEDSSSFYSTTARV